MSSAKRGKQSARKVPPAKKAKAKSPVVQSPSFDVVLHKIREVPLAELKPAPYNPRVMSEETMAGLSASLRRFGLVEPIIWNERTGFVVGGHQRLTVLQSAGAKKAQVVVIDLPPAEEKALNIALNNLNGEWNYTMLKDLLADLQPSEEDRVMLGFTGQELNALLKWGEEMSAAPDAGIGLSTDERLEIFNNNAIKQIVLYFPNDRYISILERMKSIAEAQSPPLETNSDVFELLLASYEKTAR